MKSSWRFGANALIGLAGFCVAGAASTSAILAGNAVQSALTAPAAARQVPLTGRHVSDFALPDTTGKQVSIGDFRGKKLFVIYFMGTDCPISNLYLKDLATFSKKYEARGVQVVGVQSNAGITQARAAEHAHAYKVAFPVLIDAGQRLAREFGATRTAEVFVVDRQRIVRYHGEIDDRYGYTYKRGEPTRRELELALGELLAGKTVSVPETTPRGCLITRDDRANSSGTVTYAKEIARIFQKRCQECHRAGEVAPFTLGNYDDAVEHAAMIKEVIVQRRMPPWHADPRFGDFSNNRRMSQEEIDQVVAWIDSGTPLGEKRELPPPKQFVEGWQIGKPDLVFELRKEVKVPASGTVPYRYYTVPTRLKEDVWIQAAEARPGNPSVVHHIIVFCRDPNGGGGEGGPEGAHICGTAPGDPPLVLPPGVGRRIPAGSDLVFQMHYTPNGKETTDRSKVGFVLYRGPKGEKKPTWAARTRPVMNAAFKIPAGHPNYQVESGYKFTEDATIYQLMPHMHVRGKDFLYELKRPDGRTETLLSVPQFDFNWQNTYRFTKPVSVPKGSTLHCVAHFDNSQDNPANPNPKIDVRWGDQTWEEMMIGWMTLSSANPGKQDADE